MKYLYLVLLCLINLACASEGNSEKPEIHQQWANDMAIAVIVNIDGNSTSEQYADWSHYLNEFAQEVGSEFVFYKLREINVKFKTIKPEPYSILFFKKGQPAYFYQGAITEPQVYQFIRLRYSNEDIPGFLHQFSPTQVSAAWDDTSKAFVVTP